MNERINELFDKALDEVIPNTWTNLTMDQLNDIKNYFAELIVRECMKVAVFKDDGTVATAQVAGYMAAGRSTAAKMIKEHFGVEERKGWVCPKCGIDRTREVCPKGHFATMTGDCPMTATAQTGVEE